MDRLNISMNEDIIYRGYVKANFVLYISSNIINTTLVVITSLQEINSLLLYCFLIMQYFYVSTKASEV